MKRTLCSEVLGSRSWGRRVFLGQHESAYPHFARRLVTHYTHWSAACYLQTVVFAIKQEFFIFLQLASKHLQKYMLYAAVFTAVGLRYSMKCHCCCAVWRPTGWAGDV